MDEQKYRGLMDMLDGGGAGRSGQKFEDGNLSGLMNALGIKPMGYYARMEDARPMARPENLGGMAPMQQPQIQTQPMINGKSIEEILAAINSGRLPAGPPMRPMAPPTALPSMADMMEMERRRRGGQAVYDFETGRAYPPTYR